MTTTLTRTITKTRTTPLAPLVFGDTETTSLRRQDRRIWETALIKRLPNGQVTWKEWIVSDVDLSQADQYSLEMSHFYERHPEHGGNPGDAMPVSEADLAREIEEFLRPMRVTTIHGTGSEDDPLLIDLKPGQLVRPHLIGNVPGFDEHSFIDLLTRHGRSYAAHYQPIDVEAVLVGWLAGYRDGHREHSRTAPGGAAGQYRHLLDLQPPWDSDYLASEIGLPPIPDNERHTALGDARRVMQIWDAMMGTNAPDPDGLAVYQPASATT